MRPIDVDRAYAYCKGALTAAQRKSIEARRQEDEEFDLLIKDIEAILKTADAATVHKTVQAWKITRTGEFPSHPQEVNSSSRPKEITADDSALEKLLRDQDKKKRLQKAYIVIVLFFITAILVLLYIMFF